MIKKKHLITSVAAVITLTTVFFIVSFISEDRDQTANYASLTGTIPPKRAEKQQCFKLNREGLASLNAHGSGMINYNDFKNFSNALRSDCDN